MALCRYIVIYSDPYKDWLSHGRVLSRRVVSTLPYKKGHSDNKTDKGLKVNHVSQDQQSQSHVAIIQKEGHNFLHCDCPMMMVV